MNAPVVTVPLNPPSLVGSRHGQQYSDWAYNDPAGIVTAAYRNLAGVEFDTFVCRGISGILVAPLLARAMSRNFLIVRKPEDDCHSSCVIEGAFGRKWIFLDDFISVGSTFRACREAISNFARVPSELVGAYCYQTQPREYSAERQIPPRCAAEWGQFRRWDIKTDNWLDSI